MKPIELQGPGDSPVTFRNYLMQVGGFWPTKLFAGLYGRDGIPQPLPKDVEKMREKECFSNALNLALWRNLTYVEGIGRSAIGFDCDHAWCEDEAGNVIDPTWEKPEDCLYIGFPFNAKEAWKLVCEQGYYGLFGGDMVNIKLMETLRPGFKEQFLEARRKFDTLFEQARAAEEAKST